MLAAVFESAGFSRDAQMLNLLSAALDFYLNLKGLNNSCLAYTQARMS